MIFARNLETNVSISLDPGLVFAGDVGEEHFVDSVPVGESCELLRFWFCRQTNKISLMSQSPGGKILNVTNVTILRREDIKCH